MTVLTFPEDLYDGFALDEAVKAFARVASLTLFGPPNRPEPAPLPAPALTHSAADDESLTNEERIRKVRLPVLSS